MQRHIVFIIFLMTSLLGTNRSIAQSNDYHELMAKEAFQACNYEEAAKLYESAIAGTRDTNKKERLGQLLELVKETQMFINWGDVDYTLKEWESAKEWYYQATVNNPADKYAAEKVKELNQIIARENYQMEYLMLFRTGCVSCFDEFIEENKLDEKEREYFQMIIRSLRYGAENKPEHTPLYLRAGKDFLDAEAIEKARLFLDQAACQGDTEGLYLTAMTYPADSEKRITLLAMAAEGGNHQEAKEALKKESAEYQPERAKRAFESLLKYKTDLLSAVYIYENEDRLPLMNLNAEKNLMSLRSKVSDIEDDNLIYYLSKLYEDNDLLKKAAFKGNAQAMYAYAKSDMCQSETERDAWMLMAYDGKCLSARENFTGYFIKYFNLEEYLDFMFTGKADYYIDFFNLEDYGNPGMYNPHEEMLYNCLSGKYSDDFWKKYKKQVWDSDMYRKAFEYLEQKTYKSDNDKKNLRKLSKAAHQPGQYKSVLNELIHGKLIARNHPFVFPVKTENMQKDFYISEKLPKKFRSHTIYKFKEATTEAKTITPHKYTDDVSIVCDVLAKVDLEKTFGELMQEYGISYPDSTVTSFILQSISNNRGQVVKVEVYAGTDDYITKKTKPASYKISFGNDYRKNNPVYYNSYDFSEFYKEFANKINWKDLPDVSLKRYIVYNYWDDLTLNIVFTIGAKAGSCIGVSK